MLSESESESESEAYNSKTLYICFTGFFGQGYAVRSLPVNSLFNHHETPPPPLKDVWSYMENTALTREGCGILGSNVYFVGGARGYFRPYVATDPAKYVVCCNTADGSTSFVPNVISPMPTPIVFTVGESLYVLADSSDGRIPDPAFEVCNLSTKTWEELEAPPFLNSQSEHCIVGHFFRDCRIGYVIIGKFICVTTTKASFKFDTEKKIWEPCMLFDGFSSPWVDTNKSMSLDSTPCGPPFGFYGEAVFFGNDTLICMHQPIGADHAVVAYKMIGGKVVQSQSFIAQGLTVPYDTYASCISPIGDDGYFCIAVIKCDKIIGTYVLTVKLFHLIKKKEDNEKEFLHCEVVNEFKYDYEIGPVGSRIWQPIGCFVQ